MKKNIKVLSYSQINKMLSDPGISFSYIKSVPVLFHNVKPMEMYNDIFNYGEDLEEKGKQVRGKYNLIAIKIKYNDNKERVGIQKIAIHKNLKELKNIIDSDSKEFCILSCISYAGNKNNMINARYMYALVIDLDSLQLSSDDGLSNFFSYVANGKICMPNYIVSSGHGIHLYYIFDKPVPLYKNIQNKIFNLKKEMVKVIWNDDISTIEEQHGSVIQSFRIGGTYTKDYKHKAKCFKLDNVKKYSLYDLAQKTFMTEKEKEEYKNIDKKNNALTLEEAKKKYPEWYEKRIIKKLPKGKWNIKKDLYYWWLNEIKEKRKHHHRYFCCMFACIYAIKCNIPYQQVKKDLYSLIDNFNEEIKEPFTKQDIEDALLAYKDDYYFWTRDKISLMSAIPIKTNKRNFRKQKDHIKFMNTIKKFKYENNECSLGGRKKKDKTEIYEYIKKNKTTKEIAKKFNVSLRQAQLYKREYTRNNISYFFRIE